MNPDADVDPGVTLPADWAALWGEMLEARTATGARAAAVSLARPLGTELSAWAALYRPLLQARHAPDRTDGLPWAIGQLGQSLDGCVATASGDSYFVTGEHSLLHLHRLRALCDAVLVGAGTVAADDPQLTTRRVAGPHPVRVVFDPAASLDGRARLLHDGIAPVLWLCDGRHAATARARLQVSRDTASAATSGAVGPNRSKVLPVDGLLDARDPGRGPDVTRAFRALAARGLRVLLVEGGGVTVSRCLQAGLLDRLHLVIAPVIIGTGRRGLQLPSPARMADCLRPAARQHPLGDDVLWDLALRPADAANATVG